jgi:hypothetical protein
VRNKLLQFFLSLIAITVICTTIWIIGGRGAYTNLFAAPALYLFRLLGITRSGAVFVMEHFASLIPFLALSLALPGVAIKRRLFRTGIGLALIVIGHFAIILIASAIFSKYDLSAKSYKMIFPLLLVNDAAPLIIWLSLFSSEIISLFSRKKKV